MTAKILDLTKTPFVLRFLRLDWSLLIRERRDCNCTFLRCSFVVRPTPSDTPITFDLAIMPLGAAVSVQIGCNPSPTNRTTTKSLIPVAVAACASYRLGSHFAIIIIINRRQKTRTRWRRIERVSIRQRLRWRCFWGKAESPEYIIVYPSLLSSLDL